MQNPDSEAGCDDLGLHESERWNHAFVQKTQKTCDRVNLSLRLPGRGGIFQLKLKTKLEIRKHCNCSVYMTCSVIKTLFESGRGVELHKKGLSQCDIFAEVGRSKKVI